MTKMWMIEQGSYSDYSVYGPFTTREKAVEYYRLVSYQVVEEPPEDEIVEWEVDPDFDGRPAGHYLYVVNMKENGDTVHVSVISAHSASYAKDSPVEYSVVRKNADGTVVQTTLNPPYGGRPYKINVRDQVPVMLYYMWATDEKHAIKIANERRIAQLAAGTWRT